MGDYYDVSQTTGRPMKEQPPLTSDSARMDNALASLLNYSPVAVAENPELECPARYSEANLTIFINPNYDKAAVFAALATEITFARIHDKGRNTGFERENYMLDAESVGYMVCRRFGVDCPMPTAREVAQLYEGYEPTDRSDALEQVRKTARNIGDGVERGIQPRQPERGRRNYGAR